MPLALAHEAALLCPLFGSKAGMVIFNISKLSNLLLL